jgi:SPP1 gp7 family putative phage head morphogenesis protein
MNNAEKAVANLNNADRAVALAKLKDEGKELKYLETLYYDALKQVQAKLKLQTDRQDVLFADWDNLDDVQKSIYFAAANRRKFQRQIERQLEKMWEDLMFDEYKSVKDYLERGYETGFIGTMYSLAKRDNIPLVLPIDHKKVIKAAQYNPKLSKTLYEKLGEDWDMMKAKVAQTVARGVATSSSYAEIAKNIEHDTVIGRNRAIRIARTEGHRVQCEAAFEAQQQAKKKGADIKKQWDAALDARTRDSHRRVDGEIRELDEPFSNGLLYPADDNAPAAEVINCRCALLQRAKWALGYDELETQKKRAAYFGLDKTQNFEDYKQKYLKASKKIQQAKKKVAQAAGTGVQLDIDDYSDAFTAKKAEREKTQKLIDFVNEQKNANQNTLNLYKQIGQLENYSDYGIGFRISHASGHAVTREREYTLGGWKLKNVELCIPRLQGENITGQVMTTLHEEMHLIDLMMSENPTTGEVWFSDKFAKFQKAIANATPTIGAKTKKVFDEFHDKIDEIATAERKKLSEKRAELKVKYLNGTYSGQKTYDKEVKKLLKECDETIDYENRNACGGGVGSLEDIYDALSGGKLWDTGEIRYGHGSNYYIWEERKNKEILANYGALSVVRPDLIELLREDKPELVEALEEMVEAMLKEA